MTDGFDQQLGVKYTRPVKDGDRPNIEIFTSVTSSQEWDPPILDQGESVSFQFLRHSETDPFYFSSVTFWARGAGDVVVSNVARTYYHSVSAEARFNGHVFVSEINTSSMESLSFTVTNNAEVKGAVDFELTLEDPATRIRYTTVDPQIPLRPPPPPPGG